MNAPINVNTVQAAVQHSKAPVSTPNVANGIIPPLAGSQNVVNITNGAPAPSQPMMVQDFRGPQGHMVPTMPQNAPTYLPVDPSLLGGQINGSAAAAAAAAAAGYYMQQPAFYIDQNGQPVYYRVGKALKDFFMIIF